jgi:UDP-N-acetylmuramoyl-L-alanyl-D-glutamate--2,6-diaminopimelate ligase
MTLGAAIDHLAARLGSPPAVAGMEPARLATELTGVAYDSRQVPRGGLFVALTGQRADGVQFAPQALGRGACAVVAESARPAGVTAPWIQVPDARRALSVLAAEYFGRPSEEMTVVGITGTNGKTTTSYLLASIFDQAGIPCGRMGTISYRIGTEERPAARTTPEAADLHRLLREMVERGCGACAMEVSSHALALHRADDIAFAGAIFTNLTRDHLDFHEDMEAYFRAKRRLFEGLRPGAVAVINLDDPRGASLVGIAGRPVTYAISAAADVRPRAVAFSIEGLAFDVETPRGLLQLRSRLVGRPNVSNILAAVSAAMALDLSFAAIERGVAAVEHVPGRFQLVSRPRVDDVMVVVDYAHTDDALRNLLEMARPLATGRLITVFGCGGDRDATKRPLMGAVAARLSDLVIVTSDNPRSEDPDRIVEQILRGIVPPPDRSGRPSRAREPECLAIVDRRAAIERAVREAAPGDFVLIAGKGHEQYQEIGGRVLPFDDVAVAREALDRRRTNSHVS